MQQYSIKFFVLGLFLVLFGCKSNQAQSTTSSEVEKETVEEPQQTPISIIEPSSVNPDDCRLIIRVTKISGLVVSGTITQIKERGFGFKDYINNGDNREFKLLSEVKSLKTGTVISGTITTNRGVNVAYTLRNAQVIKQYAK